MVRLSALALSTFLLLASDYILQSSSEEQGKEPSTSRRTKQSFRQRLEHPTIFILNQHGGTVNISPWQLETAGSSNVNSTAEPTVLTALHVTLSSD